MYRGNSRLKVFPIILILIAVAIGIAALVSLGRAVLDGGDQPAEQVDTGSSALLDTASDRSVRMTVRGKIVADENFRSYQVIVTPTQRKMTTYGGYLEQQIATKDVGNNAPSYEEFVHALDHTNFITAPAFTGDKDDARGICPNGRVYEFEIMQGDNVVKRLWDSSCSKGTRGSLKFSEITLADLFNKQIPDYKSLLNKITL